MSNYRDAVINEVKKNPVVGLLTSGAGATAFGSAIGRQMAREGDMRILYRQFISDKPIDKAEIQQALKNPMKTFGEAIKKTSQSLRMNSDILASNRNVDHLKSFLGHQQTYLKYTRAVGKYEALAQRHAVRRFLTSTVTHKYGGALLLAAGIGLTAYQFYNIAKEKSGKTP